MKNKIMNNEVQLANAELDKVSGGIHSILPVFPPRRILVPEEDRKEEPKDGGATYTW